MFLQSHLLVSAAGSSLFHGFFNRTNGAGHEPFNSLNVSLQVGDDPVHVQKNRMLVKDVSGARCLISAKQVHGDHVVAIDNDVDQDIELDSCDGLITDRPGVGLMIQQADCQGVLLFDPIRSAIGALHCGWRGSVSNIISKGVTLMVQRFDSDPSKMLAVISPSLGPCCSEFVNYRTELPESFQEFQVKQNYFDFWRLSVKQLTKSGLRREAVSVKKICTCCHPDYFSYRATVRSGSTSTGRNCSVICLKE